MNDKLFKALKCVSKKEYVWLFGLPLYNSNKEKLDLMLVGINKYEPIIPETLCVYTGKEDINGNAVYSGDMLHFEHNINGKKTNEVLTVYYSKESASFLLGRLGALLPFGMYDISKCKIVGNIHNEEFLTSKRKGGKQCEK